MHQKPTKLTLSQLEQKNAPIFQYRNYFVVIYKLKSPHNLVDIGDGILYYEERLYEDALKSFEAALSDTTTSLAYWFIYLYIGKCHRQLEKFDQAKLAFEEALRLRPQKIDLYLELSLILYKRSSFEDVIEWCDKGLAEISKCSRPGRYNKEKVALCLDKGKALYRLKHYLKSLEMFILARNLNPEDPIVLFNLGNALRKLEKYKESLGQYIRGIKKDQMLDLDYWRNISITFKDMGNIQASVKCSELEDFIKRMDKTDEISKNFIEIVISKLSIK